MAGPCPTSRHTAVEATWGSPRLQVTSDGVCLSHGDYWWLLMIVIITTWSTRERGSKVGRAGQEEDEGGEARRQVGNLSGELAASKKKKFFVNCCANIFLGCALLQRLKKLTPLHSFEKEGLCKKMESRQRKMQRGGKESSSNSCWRQAGRISVCPTRVRNGIYIKGRQTSQIWSRKLQLPRVIRH